MRTVKQISDLTGISIRALHYKEFDMSEYYKALEGFKTEYKDKIIKIYGSIDKYNEFIEKCKSKEDEIVKDGISKYGSIDKFVKAMKQNFSSKALDLSDECDKFKNDLLEDNHLKLKELYINITSDLTKDISSPEIQQIAEEIQQIAYEIEKETEKQNSIMKIDVGENFLKYTAKMYLSNDIYIKINDEKYGEGSSKFMGEALRFYCENKKI